MTISPNPRRRRESPRRRNFRAARNERRSNCYGGERIGDEAMKHFTEQDVTLAAAAIANARGNRRGAPDISNVLELIGPRLREEVMDDARAVLNAVESEHSSIAALKRENSRLTEETQFLQTERGKDAVRIAGLTRRAEEAEEAQRANTALPQGSR